MSPRIYTSPFPDVPVDHCSLFTKLFRSRGPNDVGGHPESWTAYVDAASGTGLTRAQVKTLSLSFAYGLRDHPTTRPLTKRGDTVLLFSPNSLAWPIVLYGSVAAGLRCTLANTAYTSHELGFQYKDSAAKLVLTYEENIGVVMKMFEEQGYSNAEARQRIVVLRRDLRWAGGPAVSALPEAAGLVSLEELLARGVLDREETFEGEAAHETVYLCYSSGTTGNPKGVETTHQNMTTLVDIIVKFPLPPGDAPMLGILPFYHIYGVANLLHHPFYIGVPVVIQTRFDPEQFCANIQKYKVAFACIVPPVLVALARHPAVDSYDLSSLQYMCSGAAPLGADLVKMVQARLLSKRKHGSTCLITQGYGLTETSPSTHMLAFDVCDERVGSIGQLFPTLKARIVADDDGLVDAEEGERGELWFQGPTIMKGYLGNPTATKHSLTSDRWFKTGDIAIRDKEGYYYIVDRKKELIKYKVSKRAKVIA
ncbi:4-coumarate--CoA ligase-like 7 [Favolaschia claudopus]|uniref:4-coumarate--CoA ligase-like 7 n=1 Tax=Favolaschia claudopus TaxID=2862362 RepID=A0AAW0CXX2_9AGAR